MAGNVAKAIAWVKAQLGTPYLWGGEGNGGFDCSGLMQMGYRAAGIDLPRTAQAQYDATAKVNGPRLPGDLVFFGTGPSDVDHVGMYLGGGMMIDAPHTGAFVRIERVFKQSGDLKYLGATRPSAGVGPGSPPQLPVSTAPETATESTGFLSSITGDASKWVVGGVIVLGGAGLVAVGLWQGVKQ